MAARTRHSRSVFLNHPLARFREHAGGITSPTSPTFVEHIESRAKVIDKLCASANLPPWLGAFKPIAYRNVYTEIGLFLCNTGHRARALRMFGRAIAAGGNPLVTFSRILWFTTAVRLLEASTSGDDSCSSRPDPTRMAHAYPC